MATLKSTLFFLMAIVVASMEFNSSMATEHVVGDSFGWAVPQNDGFYANWSLHQTFKTNDVLVFNFPTGLHTVAKVTKAAYDSCNLQNPISIHTTGPARITIDSTGNHYYICTVGQHCNSFLKLAITVAARTNN